MESFGVQVIPCSAIPMKPSLSKLLLVAVLPVSASFAVLALGAVGRNIWLIHLLAICLTCVLAIAGSQLTYLARIPSPAFAIILLTLVGAIVPLLHHTPGPNRWASLGPLNLYLAPLLLPSFFAACAVYIHKRGNYDLPAFVTAFGLSVLLAVQPDASQVLGLLAGSTVNFVRYRADRVKSAITLVAIALVTVWTFTRPDPLVPVPYVEGVFALALGHSLLAGLAISISAIALLLALVLGSFKGSSWLAAVAAYYAVLFACSVAGLTPAPLIGYGAGPLLGFGLMVAVSRWVEAEIQSDNSLRAV
mgnify:CR=1 FL=1